jgi:hypothetical protein
MKSFADFGHPCQTQRSDSKKSKDADTHNSVNECNGDITSTIAVISVAERHYSRAQDQRSAFMSAVKAAS